MERIQKALEQASRDKERAQSFGTREFETVPSVIGSNGAESPSVSSHKPDVQADTASRRYTKTRVVEVPEKVLRDNRLIAAIPKHEVRDSYRMLRTRVLQSLRGNNWNSLAVTGPASGCGKTLTAINLAISLSHEVTQTVLLIDLDLRNPSISGYFDYTPEYGIGDYLFDDVPVSEIMFSPGMDGLVVIPGREVVHNSSELLRSPKMLKLVEELKSRYPDRLLIVDLPPILAADDALAFSPYVDAMLLVVENGSTKKGHLQRSLEVMAGTNIIGTVLNRSVAPTTALGAYYADTSRVPRG